MQVLRDAGRNLTVQLDYEQVKLISYLCLDLRSLLHQNILHKNIDVDCQMSVLHHLGLNIEHAKVSLDETLK